MNLTRFANGWSEHHPQGWPAFLAKTFLTDDLQQASQKVRIISMIVTAHSLDSRTVLTIEPLDEEKIEAGKKLVVILHATNEAVPDDYYDIAKEINNKISAT